MLDLPLYSVGGIFGPHTMKLHGVVAGNEVIILIDSGASHNFVSSALVQHLQLPTSATHTFGVCLGDGHRVTSSGMCKHLQIQLGPCDIHADYFVFYLGGVDLILEVAWLATLGDIKFNWSKMTMGFGWNGQTQGRPIPLPYFSGLVVILAHYQGGPLGNFVEFGEVFGEPTGLPPQRSSDHRIELQPGAGPVSVHPYRYGHVQKDEIECLVTEMLTAGIIQHSSSPYSSPILVQKKDGSWRCYMDYREPN
ncbi:uncharacterized protein [Elaeis guineensis]|uniref:uncharacterized protein n=1 Tax=Elaeis guineensis var. tenera TaxID=51953 RepID=UPI003C6D28FD